MDREICVLVYSQYSPASKRVMDYIQSFPYDLLAVTGMTLLAAETRLVRDKLARLNITSVPCIYIKYFDGGTVLYEDEMVYAFIDSVTKSLRSNGSRITAGGTAGGTAVEFDPADLDSVEIEPLAASPKEAPAMLPRVMPPGALLPMRPPDNISSTVKLPVKGNVMAAALEMQKSREALEAANDRKHPDVQQAPIKKAHRTNLVK